MCTASSSAICQLWQHQISSAQRRLSAWAATLSLATFVPPEPDILPPLTVRSWSVLQAQAIACLKQDNVLFPAVSGPVEYFSLVVHSQNS